MKVEKATAEAAQLIREAMPLYARVSQAVGEPPEGAVARDAMIERAEEARVKLARAKALYEGVKADSPDPAALERRIAQLAEALKGLSLCREKLKAAADR